MTGQRRTRQPDATFDPHVIRWFLAQELKQVQTLERGGRRSNVSGTARNAVPLPKAKPRTMGERIVVSPIRSREITGARRSAVGNRENALQPLDFSNALFGVHPSQYLTERRRGQFGAASPPVEFVQSQHRLFS
jgi:hypothetical protein